MSGPHLKSNLSELRGAAKKKQNAQLICVRGVIFDSWWSAHVVRYVGHRRVLGVYLSALESMNVYKRKRRSPERNINKVLRPLSPNDNDRCRASNSCNFCFFIVTGNSKD